MGAIARTGLKRRILGSTAELVLDHLTKQLVSRGESPLVFAPKERGRPNTADYGYPVVRYRRPWSKRFGVRQTLPRLMAFPAALGLPLEALARFQASIMP